MDYFFWYIAALCVCVCVFGSLPHCGLIRSSLVLKELQFWMSGLLSGYSRSFPRDILTPENLNCWVDFLGLCFFRLQVIHYGNQFDGLP